jgi:hypothetical protein
MVAYSVAVFLGTSLSQNNNLQRLNANSSEDLQFYLQQVKVEYKKKTFNIFNEFQILQQPCMI